MGAAARMVPRDAITGLMCLHAGATGVLMTLSPFIPVVASHSAPQEAVWSQAFGGTRLPVLQTIGGCKLLALAAMLGAGSWMPPFAWIKRSAAFWDRAANACLLVVYLGGAYTHRSLGEPYVAPLVFFGLGYARLMLYDSVEHDTKD